MKVLNLIQGSDEWKETRLSCLCASEAPAMMGASKFMSRNQLLALKKGWRSNPDPKFLTELYESGHAHEAEAREILELELCDEIKPIVGLVEIDGLELLSSFDGLIPGVFQWEHKDWNETLAENVLNGVLEAHYYWQLEHQLLVSGMDFVKFMVSDGTIHRRVSMNYTSVPERREQLIAGWKQFVVDLENYELQPRREVVLARKQESLPALSYSVNNGIVVSNLKDYLPIIKARAEEEMSRVLETDQDFADKAEFNKAVTDARKALKDAVSSVRGEFVSFQDFAETAAEVDAILQKMQSHGERQVKLEKERRKSEIIHIGEEEIHQCIAAIEVEIAPVRILSTWYKVADFAAATKNKRSFDSMQDSVDEEVARVKVELNEVGKVIETNLKTLSEEAGEYRFLFQDLNSIVFQSEEAFRSIVLLRISSYERQQAEISLAKAKAEAEAKARVVPEERVDIKTAIVEESNNVVEDQSSTIATEAHQCTVSMPTVVCVVAKVSDAATYTFCDGAGNVMLELGDSYVPSFFPGENEGDYLILDIDISTGRIINWAAPSSKTLESFIAEKSK